MKYPKGLLIADLEAHAGLDRAVHEAGLLVAVQDAGNDALRHQPEGSRTREKHRPQGDVCVDGLTVFPVFVVCLSLCVCGSLTHLTPMWSMTAVARV